MNNTIRS